MVVYPCSEFAHVVNMGKARLVIKHQRQEMEGLKEHSEITKHMLHGSLNPPSDKDVILSVMTRLSYATHDSQCTKQNMPLIINVEHNHFDPLRSTVYHNNILRHAA